MTQKNEMHLFGMQQFLISATSWLHGFPDLDFNFLNLKIH